MWEVEIMNREAPCVYREQPRLHLFMESTVLISIKNNKKQK